MKRNKLFPSAFEVEYGDEYFNEVHAKWLPVPVFWVGDLVRSHTDRIRGVEERELISALACVTASLEASEAMNARPSSLCVSRIGRAALAKATATQ